MDACAIDFETGCNNRASACAVGLARVRGGEITATMSRLIRPPEGMPIEAFFTGIHGITNAKVRKEPLFVEVWPELRTFIGGDMLVAHNAEFDKGVLKAVLAYFGIFARLPRFECTLGLARRRWPYLPNHRLDTVCRHLGIGLRHHDALSDAVACAEIWMRGE